MKKQFILVPIPLEDAVESGIDLNDVIQTYAARGKIIIENLHEDEDCESCPCCCPECGECMCGAVMMEGEDEDE